MLTRVPRACSEDVFRLLSASTQALCRQVDRITVKGSTKPISIYTYDVPILKGLGGELEDGVDVSNVDQVSSSLGTWVLWGLGLSILGIR